MKSETYLLQTRLSASEHRRMTSTNSCAVMSAPAKPSLKMAAWLPSSFTRTADAFDSCSKKPTRKTIAETLKRNSTAQPSTWWLDCVRPSYTA